MNFASKQIANAGIGALIRSFKMEDMDSMKGAVLSTLRPGFTVTR